MTYCVAMSLNEGMVFAADTRTNAGLDNISSYRKLHAFSWPGERVIIILSAGNLATTQAVLSQIQADTERGDGLRSAARMVDAAAYLGRVSAEVQSRYRGTDPEHAPSLEATFLLGGQIAGDTQALFLVYPQGNHIACSEDQPFLQIGETKYGKPILDRIVEPGLSLADAGRCALLSLDSTMRSNLSVGPPIDLAIYEANSLGRPRLVRYKLNSPYFASIRKNWSEGMRRLFDDLPRFDWERKGSA